MSEVRITDPQAVTGTLGEKIKAYIGLGKPRIIELLLTTTVPAMIVAAHGWPGTWLVVATLVGGTLSAAGANAVNNYVDRDIDALMARTRRRTLPRHRVPPGNALVFGILLGAAGFAWLWATTNLLAASLATGALLFYVFVYTLLLKRNTPQNIVIGGAAGAAPVLVGWAVVTGTLGWAPWVMFAIIFLWTPPHFWALSLRYRDDYARAGVPMLPVVAGPEKTNRQIILYSAVLTITSLLLVPAADMGVLYIAAAIVLGAGFIRGAVRLRRHPEGAMSLFRFSNVYLTVLFVSMAADVLVR